MIEYRSKPRLNSGDEQELQKGVGYRNPHREGIVEKIELKVKI